MTNDYLSLPPLRNWPATTALVLGIIAVALAFIPVANLFLAVLTGLMALAFGTAGFVVRQRTQTGFGKSLAAMILAVSAFIIVPTANVLFFSAVDEPVVSQVEAPATADEPDVVEETEPAEEPPATTERDQAAVTAEDYLSFSGFSRTGLIEQLVFEGFPEDDAAKAVDSLGVDWDYQAERVATDYMDFSSFSKQGLVDQLEFEGFTADQAAHGAGMIFQ